jgi:hypothetical protein
VVEPVHPLEGWPTRRRRRTSRAALADELGLVQPDDDLGDGVVVSVRGADRGNAAGLGQVLGVADRHVLAPSVVVVHEPVDVPAGPEPPRRSGISGQMRRRLVSADSPMSACRDVIEFSYRRHHAMGADDSLT